MASAGLTQLTQAPSALVPTAIAALLASDSGVTMDELVLSIQTNGTVLITPTQAAYTDPDWTYFGYAEASFTKVDMGTVFGSYDLRLMLDSPATSVDVANLLATIYQVALSASDIVVESIPSIGANGTAYVLKASATSPMWTGQRTVMLYPAVVPEVEVITDTVMDGLTLTQWGAGLPGIVTSPVVSGLSLDDMGGGLGALVTQSTMPGLTADQLSTPAS